MVNYNRAQCDIVVKSEKPHEYGLRNPGISGNICSWLLRDFLRKEFPHVNFDDGVVCKGEKKGLYDSKYLSPQTDIIAYHGDPWEKLFEFVVIPIKNVLMSIEVKKWISKSGVSTPSKNINGQILSLKSFINKPVFLVAYRTTSDIQYLKMNSKADKTYIFSKGAINPPQIYPDYVNNFESKYLILKELEKLVMEIEKIIV